MRGSSQGLNPWQDTQSSQHFVSGAEIIIRIQVDFGQPLLSCHYIKIFHNVFYALFGFDLQKD